MAEETLSETEHVQPLVALGIIFGGGLVVLVLIAVLLFVCLRVGEGQKDNIATDEDPGDQAPIINANLPPRKKPLAPKPLIVLTPEEEKMVDTATLRGVDYLKGKQIRAGPESGTWRDSTNYAPVGLAALVGLTLLESKVPAHDPVIQFAAKFVREHVQQKMIGHETYQVSLAILFLSRLDDQTDRQLIRSLALRLVASQHAGGGWLYPSPELTEAQEAKLLAMLQSYASPTGAPRDLQYIGAGPKYNGPDMGDNSNTQFALLALWAARRYDLPLDPVLRLVARRFRNSQWPDGSWKYYQTFLVKDVEYPTMTAAGLLGLAVGYGLDSDSPSAQNPLPGGEKGKGEGDMAKDDILQKGFKRLAQAVGNPGQFQGKPPAIEMYFLWCVERVAVLYHLAKIDGKDWYHWGLEILLAHQDQDGKWLMHKGPGSSDIVDTCFALLFLQRANLAKDLTDKIQQLAAALGQLEQKE